MWTLTTDGLRDLKDLTPSEASTVGSHWNAVQRVLETGDETQLGPFIGVTVGGHVLETDTMTIYLLGHRGDLNFDDLYGDGGEW